MRKRKKGRTLSRKTNQRKALLRTMLVSLIKFGKIEVTLAKAKELRPFAERMVTRAKAGGSNSAVIRSLKKDLPLVAVGKLIEIGKLFKERKGGYVRIVKLAPRKSDGAEMAVVSWVVEVEDKKSQGSESELSKSEDKKNSGVNEKMTTKKAKEDVEGKSSGSKSVKK